jgi:MFS family permease
VTAAVRAASSPRGGLLRRRDFRRLWIGETTSSLGSSVTSVALPLIALTILHVDVLAVSVLAGLAWMPWVVIGLPAGAWVDRLPRRPMMMACDAVSLLAFASVPIAAWLGVLSLGQLAGVAVLGGVADVFFSTAYRAFVPALLDADDLVAANSQLQASESAAQVAGPGVAGLIAQLVGAATGMLIDAVSFAVSLSCLAGIHVPDKPMAGERRSLLREIGEGVRFVLGDRLLRTLLAFGAVANLVLGGYGAISVAYLVRELHLRAGAAGLLLAIGQAGGVGGALLAPRLARRFGSARALICCAVATAPVGLLIPLAGPGWRLGLFLLGELCLVAGVVGGNVIQRGFTQAYCPPELMGRMNTSTQVVNYGVIPVGALLAGVLASTAGFRPAMWLILGSFVAASTILLAAPIRSRRDLPAREALA